MKNNAIQKTAITGFVITFIGAVLFSTKAIAVKVAFSNTNMNGLTLLTLRLLFSLPFYIAAAWITAGKKNTVSLTVRQWIYVIFLGLFGYYLSSLFDFIGLQYISAGLERLILFLYPSFAVLINAWVFKQPVSRNQKIALILTYAGILLAYAGEFRIDTGNSNFVWGSFLIFLCAITYAIYIAGSGRIIPEVGASRFTAYAMLAATAGVFMHYLIQEKAPIFQLSSTYWIYGVYLAVFATVLPTFMLSYGIKQIGTNNVAIIAAIGPVSTIVQAHFILDEPLFAEQLIGTALVIAGIFLTAGKGTKISFGKD
ncbi:MAG: EamA family transporter [Chitinophagaceae bacterium]|nr:EamA family transporter [Chitinophagaceae bacterium]